MRRRTDRQLAGELARMLVALDAAAAEQRAWRRRERRVRALVRPARA